MNIVVTVHLQWLALVHFYNLKNNKITISDNNSFIWHYNIIEVRMLKNLEELNFTAENKALLILQIEKDCGN